jgi:hypothetical protein
VTASTPAPSYRLELTLRKPWLGWYPKPTVVLNGRGHPAQWGVGTWQISTDGPFVARVYLFNRVWRFGVAELALETDHPEALVYSAPWLPFLPGKLRQR